MANLSVKRKADRVKMCKIVFDILSQCTDIDVLEIKPDGEDTLNPREARVVLRTKRGAAVGIDFDGASSLSDRDCYVIPWHMITRTDARYSETFGHAAGGEINPFHRRKCTAVVYGFENLCERLKRVVEILNDGTAYDPEREAKAIAKNGRWQDRQAAWDAHVATMVPVDA